MNKCKNCLADIPNGRKFCNSSCAATYNNKLYPKRKNGRNKPNCLNCGKQIEGRYDRKYCNNKCQASYISNCRKDEILDHLKNKEFDSIGNKATIDRVSKKYLISIYGEQCMKCGWKEINKWTGKIPIEINHIDGNPENHNIDNLELICPNCHSLTEFFKSRGKGRKWRKTIFLNKPSSHSG